MAGLVAYGCASNGRGWGEGGTGRMFFRHGSLLFSCDVNFFIFFVLLLLQLRTSKVS